MPKYIWVLWLIILAFPSYAAVTDNIFLYYRLENYNADIGSYDLTNSGTTIIPALIDNGAYANWDADIMYTSAFSGANLINNFTINAWVNSSTGTNTRYMVSKYDHTHATADEQFSFYIKDGGNLTGETKIGASYYSCYNGTIKNATWTMVTFSFNSAGGAENMKIYINGQKAAGCDTPESATYQSNAALALARYKGSDNNRLNGTLDEVGIWTRELSQTEITQLYNNGHGIPLSMYPIVQQVEFQGQYISSSDNLFGYCNATDLQNNTLYYSYRTYIDDILFDTNEDGINCFQEIATTATSCGGLSTGSYGYNGSWNDPVEAATKVYDADYNTYGYPLNSDETVCAFMNYSKPENAVTAKWQVVDGSVSANYSNLTIPNSCFAQSSLILRGCTLITSLPAYYNYWACYNGTAWDTLRTTSSAKLREEGIYWIIGSQGTQNTLHNFHNVTSTDTEVGDQYIISCRAYDGEYYSDWFNSSILVVGLSHLNVSIYNEQTRQLIKEPITIHIFGNNITSYTSTSGTWNLSDILEGDYEIYFNSSNWTDRVMYPSLAGGINNSITAYLLNNSLADPMDVIVRDFTLTGINNATITMQRWYQDINLWLAVSQRRANAQGSARFFIELAGPYYKFIVSYKDSTIFTSNGEKMYTNIYRITTDLNQLYTAWDILDGQLTLINESLPYYFKLTYNNKQSTIKYVCLETEQETYTGYSPYNITCSGASSATIIKTFNENNSYTAKAYTIFIDGTKYYLGSIAYNKAPDIISDMKQEFILVGMLIILAIVLGTAYISRGNPTATLAALDVGLLFVKYGNLFIIPSYVLGIVLPGSLVAMYYLNKRTI